MRFLSTHVLRCAVGTAITSAICAGGYGTYWIYRLPVLGTEGRSKAEELQGKRWVFPGQAGFWISYPVKPEGIGYHNGGGGISWMERRGMMPVKCTQVVLFDYCWGNPLSSIEGGCWNVERSHYQMVGRLYYHYKPVPKGTRESVNIGSETFLKDGAQCAGDYSLVLRPVRARSRNMDRG